MSGTVNISRRLWASSAFKKETLTEREAFIWLIMEASWKERTKRVDNVVAKLERGQLAASVRFMSDAWGWTPARVQRFLKRIEKLNMIGKNIDTGVTIVTICNYDKYQNTPKGADTAAIQQRYSSDTNYNKDSIPEEKTTKAEAAYQRYLEAHPKPNDSVKGRQRFTELFSEGTDVETIVASATEYAVEVKGWSANARVQASDNFLDADRGRWQDYLAKPAPKAPTTGDVLEFWAERINGDGFVAASSVNPIMARNLIAAGLVTSEKMKERGITA